MRIISRRNLNNERVFPFKGNKSESYHHSHVHAGNGGRFNFDPKQEYTHSGRYFDRSKANKYKEKIERAKRICYKCGKKLESTLYAKIKEKGERVLCEECFKYYLMEGDIE